MVEQNVYSFQVNFRLTRMFKCYYWSRTSTPKFYVAVFTNTIFFAHIHRSHNYDAHDGGHLDMSDGLPYLSQRDPLAGCAYCIAIGYGKELAAVAS